MTSVLLDRVFDRLHHAGVRFCHLRGALGGTAPHGHREVDILLDPAHLASWSKEVLALGFVPMPVLGAGGHRFFTTYDSASGEWLKLDVVTEMRFGGVGCLYSLPGGEQILDRVAWVDGVPRPNPADAVLALTLHCLLDKRAFKEEHRRTLTQLRELVTRDPELDRAANERFDRALGSTWTWAQASESIARGDWAGLLPHRKRVAKYLFRRDPLATIVRGVEEVLRRLVRPIHAVVARRGYSVALLGPDGTGKSSLARLLAGDREIRGRIVYMGSNPKASTVGLWPSGATSFAPRLIEQAYRSTVAAFWKMRGHFVIFERHPWEGRNVPASGALSRMRRNVLLAASARPDLVVVLDAPPELLLQRTPEHDRERVEHQRERYRQLVGQISGATRLDTSGDPNQTIRGLTSTIWDGYRRHVDGGKGSA